MEETEAEYLRRITDWHSGRTWPSLCPVLSVVVVTATIATVVMIWR